MPLCHKLINVCFRYRLEEQEESEGTAEEGFLKSIVKVEANCVRSLDTDVPSLRSWRASAETIIGETCF